MRALRLQTRSDAVSVADAATVVSDPRSDHGDDGAVDMTTLSAYFSACQLAFHDSSMASRALVHIASAQQDPQNPVPLYRLAELCRERGYGTLWRQGVEIAITLDHDTYESVHFRGEAKLKLGDWSGWIDYGARHFKPSIGTLRPGLAQDLRWTGCPWTGEEDLSDKTLLMVEEGGFGDSIQSLRFVPTMVASAKHVIVMVNLKLQSFVEHHFGRIAEVVSKIDPRGKFDRYIWSTDCPALLGGLPRFEALRAPNPKVLPANTSSTRIGICWSCSNPKSRRSVRPVTTLAPLFSLPGIEWHSLQVGAGATDGELYTCIRQPSPPILSFSDTANLIASLDYAVAVDTAVCHLAGMLGVQTSTLLRADPEGRWGVKNSTPWYPSMRLIRQRTPGDWSSVIDELVQQLTGLRPMIRT